MKVNVKNLGVLKQAEFELGEFTLICGENNTGKTYATYALFGFLRRWNNLLKVDISDTTIKNLLRDGVTRIDLEHYASSAKNILRQGCRSYTKKLSTVFASKANLFKETIFSVSLESSTIPLVENIKFESIVESADKSLLLFSKNKKQKDLIVSLPMHEEREILPASIIKKIISDNIIRMLFGKSLPNPFIASAERTGAAIFRKELDFARNRLLKEMIRSDGRVRLTV